MRVLLVEDESALRPLLVRALQRGGHEVESCGDCAAAHQLATAGHGRADEAFQILVSDLSLPDGNGLELAIYLLESGMVSQAVLMSGYSLEESFVPRHLATRLSLLSKPFPMAELLECLRQFTPAETA